MSVLIYLCRWSLFAVHLMDRYWDHNGPCGGPFPWIVVWTMSRDMRLYNSFLLFFANLFITTIQTTMISSKMSF